MSTLPVAFISHGSPMLARGKGSWRRELTAWAAGLEGVKGVVVVSAHWESSQRGINFAKFSPS
jgi:4,5-DOPA dioxygenase extradiol